MNHIRDGRYKRAKKLLGELITHIKLCFPRTDGNGWNLPKMHALAKMPKNMLKFGTANNFCRQIGERALKGIVKDHAQQTQRMPDLFDQQCELREYETNLLRYVMSDIDGQCGLSTDGGGVDVVRREVRAAMRA